MISQEAIAKARTHDQLAKAIRKWSDGKRAKERPATVDWDALRAEWLCLADNMESSLRVMRREHAAVCMRLAGDATSQVEQILAEAERERELRTTALHCACREHNPTDGAMHRAEKYLAWLKAMPEEEAAP